MRSRCTNCRLWPSSIKRGSCKASMWDILIPWATTSTKTWNHSFPEKASLKEPKSGLVVKNSPCEFQLHRCGNNGRSCSVIRLAALSRYFDIGHDSRCRRQNPVCSRPLRWTATISPCANTEVNGDLLSVWSDRCIVNYREMAGFPCLRSATPSPSSARNSRCGQDL